MIKKIGEYYILQDYEEIFIENIEKKQMTLFSLLYNMLNKEYELKDDIDMRLLIDPLSDY